MQHRHSYKCGTMKKGMLFEAVAVTLLILLSFTLYVMVASSPGSSGSWTVTGVTSEPDYTLSWYYFSSSSMFVGENGVLYTIDGRNVHALDKYGSVLWSIAIPDYYHITIDDVTNNISALGENDTWMGFDASVINGTLYMIVTPTNPKQFTAVLLAVSPDGKLEWTLPFSSSGSKPSNVEYVLGYPRKMTVIDSRIYVDLYNGKAVIATDGTFLSEISGDLYLGSSVDEEGNIYAITADLKPIGKYDARKSFDRDEKLSDIYPMQVGLLNGTILGGSYNSITAYYPDGTVKWHRNIEEFGINDTIKVPFYVENDPTYRNNTIYFWLSHSVLALDQDGNFEWYHTFDGYTIEKAWFGSDDLMYVRYGREENDTLVRALFGGGLSNPLGRGDLHIAIIRPDGNMEKVPDTVASNYVPGFLGFQQFEGDIIYKIEYVSPFAPDEKVSDIAYLYYDFHDYIEDYLKANGGEWDFPRGLYDLDTARVTAYRMNSSIPLWNYTIPLNKHTVKLDPEKADNILINPGVIDKDNNVTRAEWYRSRDIPRGSGGIGSMLNVKVTEGNGIQYISLWSYNYEIPAFYGDSRCVYSGGIYALDSNGTLIWSKETDSRVTSMEEHNGTIYYSTSNGKLSAAGTGFAAGLFTAAIYVFLRFFLAGAVTRVRGRINKNENRNRILRFIIDKPGSGLYEISQKLGINLGTTRYHLLILGMNHKVVQYRSDGKYIRYFTNSASYSQDEQFIISLMRRDGISKVLRLLLQDPGMSNVELSKALNVQESVTSRYMKELLERGVVSKAQMSDGRLAYTVKAEYNDTVGSVAKRLNES